MSYCTCDPSILRDGSVCRYCMEQTSLPELSYRATDKHADAIAEEYVLSRDNSKNKAMVLQVGLDSMIASRLIRSTSNPYQFSMEFVTFHILDSRVLYVGPNLRDAVLAFRIAECL